MVFLVVLVLATIGFTVDAGFSLGAIGAMKGLNPTIVTDQIAGQVIGGVMLDCVVIVALIIAICLWAGHMVKVGSNKTEPSQPR
jgi:hypothetical protein